MKENEIKYLNEFVRLKKYSANYGVALFLLEMTDADRACDYRRVRFCCNGKYADVSMTYEDILMSNDEFDWRILSPIKKAMVKKEVKMTRAEAIEKLSDAYIKAGSVRSRSTIDGYLIMLETLGLLKFDEPEYDIHSAIYHSRSSGGTIRDQSSFIENLIKLGYKIVKI